MTSAGDALRSPGVRSLRAPAKINLGLRLLGIRDDGYHLLESIFAPIELWDELEIAVEPGPARIELEVDLPPRSTMPAPLAAVASGSDNLVVRAAEAFCKATGLEAVVRIRLRKRIPVGAGLGGGSSDAAAVLLGLADRMADPPGADALSGIALGLGADVPFFLSPGPARVRGIGELIEPLPGLPPLDLVLANPGISLATAEVYRTADELRPTLTEPRAGSTMRAISRLSGEAGDLLAGGNLLVNDLEPAARRLCPPIARVFDLLHAAGALGVGLSGSGATVFGVFASRGQANGVMESLRSESPNVGWVEVTRVIS